jgi:hypothetical protein
VAIRPMLLTVLSLYKQMPLLSCVCCMNLLECSSASWLLQQATTRTLKLGPCSCHTSALLFLRCLFLDCCPSCAAG